MNENHEESVASVRLSRLTITTAIVATAVILPVIIVLLWKLGASPFQFFSLPIILATCAISAWMAVHWREWRAIPVSVVAGMIVAWNGIGLAVGSGLVKSNISIELLSEMMLWAVAPLGFASVAYLWRIFENQARFAHAQEALELSESRYRHLVENATDAFYVADAEGKLTLLNTGGARIFDRRSSDLIGSCLFDLISEQTCNDIKTALARQINDGVSAFYHEFPVAGRDGKVTWVGENLQAITENGVLTGFQAVMRDITESKENEENVRIVEFALDNADEHVFMLNNKGTIVYANKRAMSSLGYTAEEMLSKTIHDIDPQVSGEDWTETWRAAKAGEWPVSESIHVTADGKSFPVITSSNYFEFKDQCYIFAFVRDISREADLTSQLRQSQKIEAIGMLAGGVAHDFNNILSAIVGYTELAIGEAPKEGNLHAFLTEVKKASDRAAGLVNQILTFSRSKEQEHHPIILGTVIKEALKLLRGSLPSTIEVRHRIQPDTAPVMSDPVQIHQVIMNLCTNSYHAMREQGGVLDVKLREVEIGPQEAVNYLNITPGTFIQLSVQDTGCGMDEETRRRIFDPFFTTKPDGEGTGLGLATVLGIVRGHKGAIHVESAPGKGTSIDILLPVCIDTKTRTERDDEDAPAHGKERVMVVDDERPIADSTGIALERLGYRPLICYSGREAMEHLRAGPSRFDILVTDYTMPGMTGIDLAREAHEMEPGLPIILCTGIGSKIGNTSDSCIREVLRKPLPVGLLTRKLRAVLDNGH